MPTAKLGRSLRGQRRIERPLIIVLALLGGGWLLLRRWQNAQRNVTRNEEIELPMPRISIPLPQFGTADAGRSAEAIAIPMPGEGEATEGGPPEPDAAASDGALTIERDGEAVEGELPDAVPAIHGGEDPVAEAEETTLVADDDDLTLIEGIGPKIARVLQAAGITSFAQLADVTPEALTETLRAADLRLANPATWPEQALFAATADWDGLKELQSQLKGGQRV